ncbi:MAG: FtsX-like permease family protein, partial [Pseudomonadota bacterium]
MRLLKSFVSELRSNHRFTLLFVINLSLGLAGFVALDAFRVSIDQTMKSRSKKILGSDMGISARRPLTDEEVKLALAQLPKGTQQAQTTEFYSMVAPTSQNARATRLVKIKAVDEFYPFYGGRSFLDGEETEASPFVGLHDKLAVWVYKELLFQLEVEKGDSLKIGEQYFEITRVIEEDSTAGMGASFAPTVYIAQKNVPSTGLITKGSVAWHSRLYKLPGVPDSDLDEFKKKIFNTARDGDLRVYTHLEASEQMARLLQTLNDYLGLVAIVALLLAAVGTGFLYRSFFSGKVTQVAVLMTLGLSQSRAAFLYMVQLMILGLVSSCVAMALGFLFVPVIQQLTQELLAIPFVFVIPKQTLLLAACLGVLGSFLVGLPFLAQIRELSPALLLKGDYAKVKFSGLRFLIYSAPALIAVWGLSVWQAHSWVVGSSFLAALLGTALLLVILGALLLKVLRSLSGTLRAVAMKFALKDMAAHTWTSISCFLAIGLGAVLINLVPQVRASLQQELTAPETTNLPSLFMFDIQEDQVGEIERVAADQTVKLKQVSPMIRARLMAVND